MKTKNIPNSFAFLTYSLVFIVFFISKEIFSKHFIIVGTLLSLGGFILSWSTKNKAEKLKNIVANNIVILFIFLWMVYGILNSSFLFEEILLILLKGILALKVTASFNSYNKRNLACIQILSLFIFACFPFFVNTATYTYKALSVLYVFVWILILRFNLDASSYTSFSKISRVYSSCLIVLAISLSFAFMLKENIFSPRMVLYKYPFLGTAKIDIEEKLYKLQNALNEKIITLNRNAKSIKEKSKTMKLLSSLFGKSSVTLEVEKAREGLMDFLRRPGPGLEKGKGEEIALLKKYVDTRAAVENRDLRDEIREKINETESSSITKLSVSLTMNTLGSQEKLEKINSAVTSLKETIEKTPLDNPTKNELKEKIKELRSWKIYSLYNAARGILEDNIEKIKNQNCLGEETILNFSKDIAEAMTVPEILKLHKTIKDSDEIEEFDSACTKFDFKDIFEKLLEYKLELALMEKKKLFQEKIKVGAIKKEIKTLPAETKIDFVKIQPKLIRIPLGEKGKLSATAIYSDSSQIDVTSHVAWESSKPKNAVIELGNITSLALGETTVYAYLKEVRSNPSWIIIQEPKLTSITLNLKEINVEIGKNISIKATGFYTDNSKKDITEFADWFPIDKNILRMVDKGVFKAKKLGETEVYAQYKKIKSLPVKISVFIPPLKVLGMILFSFLAITAFFSLLFYVVIKIKIINLKKLVSISPSNFIINLYENIKKVLGVLGLPHQETLPLLKYTYAAQQKFSIRENILLNLTEKLFEVQYSSHAIRSSDALYFLNNYNKYMQAIKEKLPGFPVKSLLLLFRLIPFSI
ncbi:MAG: hypothetical protein KKC11_01165 [Candidatus Omnitrophica bacterium]|nr:hypothetical protein [Candidatus Omnitrophota bacterium]MBU1811305.1 hypothetical protein [Candidatus Omnitrophota bacterium]